MTRKSIVLWMLGCAVLGAAGYGLYSLGVNHGEHVTASSTSAVPAHADSDGGVGSVTSTSDKKILYWHDPMVPGARFDKPGKSPFMNMPLVPVYADGDGGEAGVTIDPRVQQNLGIRTAEVTRDSAVSAFEAVGSVSFDERAVAVVQARNTGYVEKLRVRAPLAAVRQGQALAELYVPEWVAAQEEYLAVKRLSGTGLDTLLDGARQRMRLAGMSEEQIRLIETTGKLHSRLTLTAPIDGVVAELTAREGMTVMAGAPLFRINGLATVWVNADVPESYAGLVQSGDKVKVRIPTSATTLEGRVIAVLPEVEPVTRTFKARIELPNPGGRLVPGMFVNVELMRAAGGDVLLVPTEAVIQTGRRTVVIIRQDNGGFMPVDVALGHEANGRTEIRSGLHAGQHVVVSGQFLLDSEANLKATITRMSAAPGASADAPAVTHRGSGRIETIGKDAVVISHGPIPSLHWGPMTMGFKPPAAGMPEHLAVGSNVVFEIRSGADGMFEIASIAAVDATHTQPAHGTRQ